VVSANEFFSSAPIRERNHTFPVVRLKQQSDFLERVAQRTGVFNFSGALPTAGTDVTIIVVTTDGVGNITLFRTGTTAGVIT